MRHATPLWNNAFVLITSVSTICSALFLRELTGYITAAFLSAHFSENNFILRLQFSAVVKAKQVVRQSDNSLTVQVDWIETQEAESR
jgi:type IV secretory pathway TrbF-like protein